MATISDVVLKTAVGVRLEAGVDVTDIRKLIDCFAGGDASSQSGDGIVGFLGIEDIPQHRRDAFLAALADLWAPSEHGSPASVLGLQQAIDRLHADHQSALDADAAEHAQALLRQIEHLQEERRRMLRQIGRAVPWGGKTPAA